MASAPKEDLERLDTDERLAFWLNVYNAATGAGSLAEPERFEHRRRFFGESIVTMAGTKLSLY